MLEYLPLLENVPVALRVEESTASPEPAPAPPPETADDVDW